MKRKFLGIPVPLVAIVLTLLLAGGAVMAAFLMTRNVPSTISIVGEDAAEVYADEACTIPLTDLAFNDIMPGETTDSITFWVKNESDPSGMPFYITLSQSGLNPMLILYEDSNGVITEGSLPLVTGTDYLEGYFQAGSPATSILGGIDVSATLIEAASIDGFTASGNLFSEGEVIAYTGLRPYEAEGVAHWAETGTTSTLYQAAVTTQPYCMVRDIIFPAEGGMIKIEDEMVAYSEGVDLGDKQQLMYVDGVGAITTDHPEDAIVTLMEWVEASPEVLAAFTGCIRGAEDTTAIAHAAGASIAQAEWMGSVGGDLYDLLPGEVLPVIVYLEASLEISRGDFPFTLIITVND